MNNFKKITREQFNGFTKRISKSDSIIKSTNVIGGVHFEIYNDFSLPQARCVAMLAGYGDSPSDYIVDEEAYNREMNGVKR